MVVTVRPQTRNLAGIEPSWLRLHRIRLQRPALLLICIGLSITSAAAADHHYIS